MKCPKCSYENKEDALYCNLCHNVLVTKMPLPFDDPIHVSYLSNFKSRLLKPVKNVFFTVSALILLILLVILLLLINTSLKIDIQIPLSINQEETPVIIPVTRIRDPIRDIYLDSLENSIISNGDQEIAAENLKRILYLMFKDADPGVLQRIVNSKVFFVIIPQNKKLTDMPQFSYLRGQKTFDGREWNLVRGIGGKEVGLPEDNLIGIGKLTYYMAFHEIGHMVMCTGLPAINTFGIPSDADIENLYVQCHGNTGLGEYASLNAGEMFAEGVAVYFGSSKDGISLKHLEEVNAPLCHMLLSIFGPPKNIPNIH